MQDFLGRINESCVHRVALSLHPLALDGHLSAKPGVHGEAR
jgi:hypothetical protein